MAYSPDECRAAAALVLGESPPSQSRVFAYPEAGYFGLRTGDMYLMVDAGRVCPDDLPAHGHGDIGSFELSLKGQRLIVDQGVFEYIAGEKRRASRTATSHNVLVLQGSDQAEFFGAFRCGRRPSVDVRDWQCEEDGFALEVSHNGFSRLPGRPVAVRRFEATPNRLIIKDWIERRTDRAGSIGLLLHPDVQLFIESGRIVVSRDDAVLHIGAPAPFEIVPAVYWPDMGRERPTNRIVFRQCSGFSIFQLTLAAVG
jgi:uncharacterized heparinase superfamily protein